MISINNLSYLIGGRALYQNASLHIKPKDKIGLIGLNGTGKSTLLRLIDEEFEASSGDISKSKDCSIGFLNQDLLSYISDDSILSVAMQAFEEAMKLQKTMDQLLHQMETNYEDALVEKLTKAQEQFETLDGYALQSKTEELLEGIGFKTSDLNRPLKEFSGGWRMRVMLAKLLLEKPSLLMLDEPTNHLDLPSIQWIENYLKTYEGAIIIVSHDRKFLNNVINKTVEVAHQKLNLYSGNYSFYLKEKELRSEFQKNAFVNQQQQIKQTEKFIERFRSKATKARQVQSRVKSLDRMDMIENVVDDNPTMNFKFLFKQKSGRFIIELKDISKAYGDLEILKNTSATIERGDKIALIGANGKGKSTMLRVIAGDEEITGKRTKGHNVITSFYAQHQLEALNVENEVLQELSQAGSEKTEMELRGVLGCFLFTDDDVFKKIKVLSGGEKSRVALAKSLISEANFLMMDEPTNHLDFLSVNILVQALQQYLGTFVIVSHDRHFISQIANKIWYIQNKEIKEYPGTYKEYEHWQQSRLQKPQQVAIKKETKPKGVKTKSKTVGQENELKKLQKELSIVERHIEKAEQSKAKIEEEMSLPEVYGDFEKLGEKNKFLQQIEVELESNHARWEALAEKIDANS